MLERSLRLIEEAFPSTNINIDKKIWATNLPLFCNELTQVTEELFGVAKYSVPSRVFSESKREIVVTTMPGIVVSEYRFRP